jgi:hypothetical protein
MDMRASSSEKKNTVILYRAWNQSTLELVLMHFSPLRCPWRWCRSLTSEMSSQVVGNGEKFGNVGEQSTPFKISGELIALFVWIMCFCDDTFRDGLRINNWRGAIIWHQLLPWWSYRLRTSCQCVNIVSFLGETAWDYGSSHPRHPSLPSASVVSFHALIILLHP